MTTNFCSLNLGNLFYTLRKADKMRWILAILMGSALLSPQLSHAQSRSPRPSPPPAGLVSGATRGECPLTNAAIAPDDNHLGHLFPTDSEDHYAGYTTDSTPTLWAHLPFSIDENSPLEFVLKQADTRDVIYSSGPIATQSNAGVIGFEVPMVLEPNVGYHWLVRVYCSDPTVHNPSQFIRGGIIHIEGDYDLSERWYDELNEIAAAYQANQNDAAWTNMLEQTALSDMPETDIQHIISLPL